MKIYDKDLIREWVSLGITEHDIVELLALRSSCAYECDNVSRVCSYEGLPSHGVEYEIRCKGIRRRYTEDENEILSKYDL